MRSRRRPVPSLDSARLRTIQESCPDVRSWDLGGSSGEFRARSMSAAFDLSRCLLPPAVIKDCGRGGLALTLAVGVVP
jgi:hypothetical protein